MSRSAAFALPILHRFGVGFLVLRLKEKQFYQSKLRFDERFTGFGDYQSRSEHTALSHTFMNCWQRITNYFDLHSAAWASNCWPSGGVLIDLARGETLPRRNVTFPSRELDRLFPLELRGCAPA